MPTASRPPQVPSVHLLIVIRSDLPGSQVPTLKGAVIEQPGGEVQYGRPDAVSSPSEQGAAPADAGAIAMQFLFAGQYLAPSQAATLLRPQLYTLLNTTEQLL
jgi:hypothetical protein